MTKTFKEVVAGIRTAIYGREVREDIAQGMEYVEGFANTAASKASEATSSATSASQSAQSAASSKSAAAASASSASTSASSAQTSATNAAASAKAAKASEDEATRQAALAGTRAGTDKTLSIADAPADAKQVGDELAVRYTKDEIQKLIEDSLAAYRAEDYAKIKFWISDDPTSPAELFGGTWEQIAGGRALMGANTYHHAGTTAEAGLPNISGRFAFGPNQDGAWIQATYASGCFTLGGSDNVKAMATVGEKYLRKISVDINASNSSSIYGNSATVQPPAYYTYIWKRVE